MVYPLHAWYRHGITHHWGSIPPSGGYTMSIPRGGIVVPTTGGIPYPTTGVDLVYPPRGGYTHHGGRHGIPPVVGIPCLYPPYPPRGVWVYHLVYTPRVGYTRSIPPVVGVVGIPCLYPPVVGIPCLYPPWWVYHVYTPRVGYTRVYTPRGGYTRSIPPVVGIRRAYVQAT